MTKKTFKFLLIGLAFLMSTPLIAKAAANQAPENIYIPKEETRDGNVYLVAQSIVVDGNINGDLICATQNLTVNGQISGDIIAVAQTININGAVAGNLRAAASDINLNGPVQKNINIAAGKINFSENAVAGQDLLIAATTADIKGSVLGNVYAYTDIINISGKIAKNVYLKTPNNSQANAINIYSDAIINGNLAYTSKTPATIINKAAITGQVSQTLPKVETKNNFISWTWGRLYSLFAALVVALVLVTLFKKKIVGLDTFFLENKKKLLLPGIIALILMPIIAIILAITFIGLPLAAILLALWFIAMYLAKIFIALAFGSWLSGKYLPKQKNNQILVLVIGVTATWLIFSIPFIGPLIALIATILGLGLIYSLKKESY